jgi:hypothetical protein
LPGRRRASPAQGPGERRCGNCFEAAATGGHALVRGSKNPDALPLVFAPDEAKALVEEMKADDFDFLLDL